ncbi:MAG: DedA family protein [Acidobacteriia bacterium]|nr:DedA family protein [Terriglobia bacterium]
MQDLFNKLLHLFILYGYWTVFFGVMLENAGLPVPGETVLLAATFLAANSDLVDLKIQWIIVIAVCGATLGDNLGYLIGRHGGRPFLMRLSNRFLIRRSHIEHAERVFRRYGAVTVFFARFITGLRVVAGPFAGVLHLPWPKFLIFNFAGAVVWSTAISLVGYFFGSEWPLLIKIVKRFSFFILGLFVLIVIFLYRRHRRKKDVSTDPVD